MEGRLEFFFDEEGDVLDISVGKPRKAVTKELENDLAIRLDPKTNEIVGFTVINFTKRFKISKKPQEFKLPLAAKITVKTAPISASKRN